MKTLTSFLVGGFCFLFFINFASAATADHLVISQVQITGGPGQTTNDFVEIYNPTAADIDLNGMRLVKRTQTGTSDTSIKVWLTSTITSAHGYYLWANSSYTGIAVTPNAATTDIISDNNGVALRNGPNNTGTIVDSVAWGQAANAFVEAGVFATNPAANQSLERKPGSGAGNGEDSNNNADDFFLQTAAHPRNSTSPVEPAGGATVTSTPETVAPPGGGGGFFELEISEILPNPKGSDSGAEWVEVYNGGASPLDLSGWYLDDEGPEDLPSSNALVVPANTVIAGRSYLAVTIPKGKFALNNAAGDAVRIFDKSKILKLRLAYPGPAKEGWSYGKDSSNQWAWTDSATPGAANNFSQAAVFPSGLRISEVLANPEGDDVEGEFIEVHNFGSDSVDLTDWVVADNRKRYRISDEDFLDTEIGPGKYFVFWREVTGISLNNSGEETVQLFNPAGEIVDQITFNASGKAGQAYVWEAEKLYNWSNFLTPGAKNKFGSVAEGDQRVEVKKPQATSDTGQMLPVHETKTGEEAVVGQVAGSQTATLPRTGANFWLILVGLIGFCYSTGALLLLIKRKEIKT